MIGPRVGGVAGCRLSCMAADKGKEISRGTVVVEAIERRESFVENSFQSLKIESQRRLLLKKLSS